jgi:hypothetical protein
MNQEKTIVITPGRRVGRFFGYSGIFFVWVFLFAVVIGLLAAIPVSIVMGASDNGGMLAASPGVIKVLADPVQIVVAIVILIPLLGMAFGYGVIYLLLLMTFTNVVLSAIYIGRSLNPKYKNEPLSTSKLVDGTIDPRYNVLTSLNPAPLFNIARLGAFASIVTGTLNSKTAISLLPVRGTPVTSFFGKLSLLVWSSSSMSLELVGGMSLVGVAYIVTVIWVFWPVTSSVGVLIWSLVSAVIFAYGSYLAIRAFHALLTEPSAKKSK